MAGPFEVTRLVFAPSFRHGPVEPERGYLVVVLDGSVEKSFASRTSTLSRSSIATLACGRLAFECVRALLDADSRDPADGRARLRRLFGTLLSRHRHLTAAVSTTLGWRMACELESRDAGWSLALEGLVLQLLAATGRVAHPPDRRAQPTGFERHAT